jgi:AraC family transcriptional regulator
LTQMEELRDAREPTAKIIHDERSWFEASGEDVTDRPRSRVVASRWTGNASGRREHISELDLDCHVLGVALRSMADLTVLAAGKPIQSGYLPQGSMRVHEPGLPMRGIFQGQFDILHLHIPNALIAEYSEARCDGARDLGRPIVDPVAERLARTLIHAEELADTFGRCYVDAISLAIIARLFGGHHDCLAESGAQVSSLAKWRLKRATEFITANLGRSIGLAEIANAAGLSRMHFAAQFRIATGLQPHEYLQRRRIECTQELLLNSDLPLVEIAFEAGFKTQSHFTTVFSRVVGQTPNAWRQRNSGRSEYDKVAADLMPPNLALRASPAGVGVTTM